MFVATKSKFIGPVCACMWYVVHVCGRFTAKRSIGIGTTTNQLKRGQCPHSQSHVIHAVLHVRLTMIHHMKFQEQVAKKSVLVDLPFISSLTLPRNSCQREA